jgi:hypothetical protein
VKINIVSVYLPDVCDYFSNVVAIKTNAYACFHDVNVELYNAYACKKSVTIGGTDVYVALHTKRLCCVPSPLPYPSP